MKGEISWPFFNKFIPVSLSNLKNACILINQCFLAGIQYLFMYEKRRYVYAYVHKECEMKSKL